MPKTWKSPFSLPNMPQEEFERRRAEYIEKYGYTVTIPGWEDVMHIGIPNRMTDREKEEYTKKNRAFFSDERWEEIKHMKQRRKETYLRILSSPEPTILRSRASILTAIDNAEDAIVTFGVMMKILVKTLPRVFSKALVGPVGWIMTGADILNLMTMVMTPERLSRETKRVTDSITELNPFTKKARIKRAKNLIRGKISVGETLEVLQTTDQIFGIGISLGALMNLPFDAYYGLVHTLEGKQVKTKLPIAETHFWNKLAGRTMKSLTTLFQTGYPWEVSPTLAMLITSNLTAIAMWTTAQALNLHEKIQDYQDYVVSALIPIDPITKEVIAEFDSLLKEVPDTWNLIGNATARAFKQLPGNGIAWPGTGNEYETYDKISKSCVKPATDGFKKWCYDNRYNWNGFVGATLATQGTMYNLETLEGPGSVEYDYIAHDKTFHALLEANYMLPWYGTIYTEDYWYALAGIVRDDLFRWKPQRPGWEKYERFAVPTNGTDPPHIKWDKVNEYLNEHESNHTTPTTIEFLRFVRDQGFYEGDISARQREDYRRSFGVLPVIAQFLQNPLGDKPK